MKQIITRVATGVGWATASNYMAIMGEGVATGPVVFGIDAASIAMPVAGTFRNLVFYVSDNQIAHPTVTLTLYKNGVATSLSAFVTSLDTIGSDNIDEVSFVEGDIIAFKVELSEQLGFPGLSVGFSIEFEGAKQFYGILGDSGGQNDGIYRIGGALGNGVQQNNAVSPSNTYSLCSVPGIIDALAIRTFAGEPGVGVWTAWIVKNGVVQDGTGGTVDTTVTMTGTDVYAKSTFSLSIALADRIDILNLRTGSNSPFANAQCAGMITFVPTDSVNNPFMLTGGNNNSISDSAVGWRWNDNAQLAASEDISKAPIGFLGLKATGLYVEISAAPGSGSYDYTLRKNGIDTIITINVANAAESGLVEAEVDFVYEDFIDIQITPNSPSFSNHLYWGLAAYISAEGDEPIPPTVGSGIYKIVPGKTDDTLWQAGNTELDVKIPDPYFKTALLGE